MIHLSIRFDDPSATSDRALEEGIFAVAQAAGIPITVAVVPFSRQESGLIPLTQERAAHLIDAQRAGVIEVAQHGYCHVSARGEKLPRSEFMGMDAACQTELICAGKMLLETVFDKPIIGFVPPWGTFDAATTHALEKLNFRYISGGWGVDANCSPSLSYLPTTCQMTSLPNTLNELDDFAPFDLVVNAVMHHYDFAESGNPQALTDLNRFRTLLKMLTQDERVQITSLSAVSEMPSSHLPNILRQNACEKLPWKIRSHLPKNVILTQGWLRQLWQSFFHLS